MTASDPQPAGHDPLASNTSPPQQPPQDDSPTATDTDSIDIPAELADAEATLQYLKERYAAIQAGPATRAQLEAQLQTLQGESQHLKEQTRHQTDSAQKAQLASQRQAILKEIQQLQEQLNLLTVELESRLLLHWFSRDKREWFWQFLRFAGLGFGAALLLQSLLR